MLHSNLIASAQGGDPAAINTLLAAAQPDIRRYARTSCRATDIDDAVQDALCVLHQRIGTLRVAAAFSAWLFTIVHRECLRLARNALGNAQPLDGIDNSLALASRPPNELRLDLAAAISSLPAHYREVLLLCDLEELTIDEIAGRLGQTRETTKARLHRARHMVREYLRD